MYVWLMQMNGDQYSILASLEVDFVDVSCNLSGIFKWRVPRTLKNVEKGNVNNCNNIKNIHVYLLQMFIK